MPVTEFWESLNYQHNKNNQIGKLTKSLESMAQAIQESIVQVMDQTQDEQSDWETDQESTAQAIQESIAQVLDQPQDKGEDEESDREDENQRNEGEDRVKKALRREKENGKENKGTKTQNYWSQKIPPMKTIQKSPRQTQSTFPMKATNHSCNPRRKSFRMEMNIWRTRS